MDNTICLIWAPVIAIAVEMLKKIPFVKKQPKVVAAVLAIALTVARSKMPGAGHVEISELVRCVLEQFATAVAVNEVAIKPVRKATL